MQYELLVFIGRFQPFHLGHLHVVRQALAQAKHVCLLCGSSFQPRNLRNPWDFDTRKKLIAASMSPEEFSRVTLVPVADLWYQDEQWSTEMVKIVAQLLRDRQIENQQQVGFIGYYKDSSCYHLQLFPEFSLVQVTSPPAIHATQIRQACFTNSLATVQGLLAPGTFALLQHELTQPTWRALQQTYDFVSAYQASWSHSPYPPVFTTVDALVVHRGSVLLVERRAEPGRGLWALPGGFIEVDERLQDACWRELQEETALACQRSQFESWFRRDEIFDHPHRSDLGRVISYVRYHQIPDELDRPKSTAGDDAAAVFWRPLADIKLQDLAFDHYFIVQKLLKIS